MASGARSSIGPGTSAAFVGREQELNALAALLEPDSPRLLWVSGIAGIGKSALLRRFVDASGNGGRSPVLTIDGEITEPTEQGFLSALGDALGDPSLDGLGDAVAALTRREEVTVVAVDTFERMRLIDDWLRRAFVPALPPGVRLLVLGRDAPVAAWHARLEDGLRHLELDTLGGEEAVALLENAGIERARATTLAAALRGHPLALRLAGSTSTGLELGAVDPPTAFDELTRVYLEGLDPELRRTLDAACVSRRVTIPLLAALLPDGPATAGERFDSLRALPFVTLGRDGLVVHHVLREVVAAELRARDPARYREYRRLAWRLLREQLDEIVPGELWRHTADMLYLLGHPAIRNAFFPTDAPRYSIERAGRADRSAVEAIAAAAGAAAEDGSRSSSALQEPLEAWWQTAPETFYVARDASGEVAGFSAVGSDPALLRAVAGRDPVAAAWLAHARREPAGPDGRLVLIRFMLSAESGERPAAAQSALYLDLKRIYLTLRPALRRMYTCAYEFESMEPILRPLGFEPLEDVTVDGLPHRTYVNELGPGSVDEWLARLAAEDIAPTPPSPLDPESRRLTVGGTTIDLSRLEAGVVASLLRRQGGTVRRQTLIEETWGAGWDGDGNALEAVISSLRRKLGERERALVTIRGVGYRLNRLE